MNQIVPIDTPALPPLVTAAVERASLPRRRLNKARGVPPPVRLARRRPGRADQSSVSGARASACRHDRTDAGAGWQAVAQTVGLDPGHDIAGSARPRVDRHLHPLVRAHRGRVEDEGRGLAAAGRRLDHAATRERWQAAHDAVSPRPRRSLARLYRCCRPRRGSQGLAVSHQSWSWRHDAVGQADGSADVIMRNSARVRLPSLFKREHERRADKASA